MPEIGGTKLAAELKTGLAGLKKGIDELKLDLAGALSEFSSEMNNGREVAKRIRKEAADVRSAVSELLGNESAEPPKANGGG
jgi:hypothetical protein